MTLQYTAVGIQNESHMATSIDDYWKDLERLQTSIGYSVWYGIVAWTFLFD